MTDAQAKTIAFIRQRGGEVSAGEIPTYRYRSVDLLVRDGLLEYITCGSCVGCQFGKRYNEAWHCDTLRVRYIGNKESGVHSVK